MSIKKYDFNSLNYQKFGTILTKFLKNNCMQPLEYMSEEEMEKYLLSFSNVKDIYFIGESYIGTLPLKEAVKKAGTGEICIIYCGNGIGYYQGEQECGKPPRFLLFQK